MPNLARAHVVISGRVIMVGFRAACEIKARQLKLTGWVKNLNTKGWPIVGKGEVEAVFEGSEADVEEMLVWCRQGPTLASIDKIDIKWEKVTAKFNSFEVRY